MNSKNRKKSLIMAAVVTSALTLGMAYTCLAAANAENTENAGQATKQEQIGNAGWPCPAAFSNPELRKQRTQFMNETKDLRRQIAVKRTELNALVNAAQPDSAKIQQVAGELFDLREQMREKAQASGLPAMGMGRGMNCGPCGMGQGFGRNRAPRHGGYHRW